MGSAALSRNSWAGAEDIRSHLIDDILFVRLQGVLTAAEQHLVKSLPAEKGRDLLKQVRNISSKPRPLLEVMVQEITGIAVTSMHHDVSTVSGEEVVLFRLAEAPKVRETRRNERRARQFRGLYVPPDDAGEWVIAGVIDDIVTPPAATERSPSNRYTMPTCTMHLRSAPRSPCPYEMGNIFHEFTCISTLFLGSLVQTRSAWTATEPAGRGSPE